MPALTDIQLQQKGLHVLVTALGEVDTFRFLAQMSHEVKDALTLQEEAFRGMSIDEIYEQAKQYEEERERSDDSKWRRRLFENLTFEDISEKAMTLTQSQKQ